MASDRLLDPGSSPLTRGKRLCYCLSYAALGLIPAHAGKTATSRGTARYPPAHPRSRGENAEQQSNLPSPAGSSPLTRGKLGLSVSFGLLWRLIPAHAGKTSGAGRGRAPGGAHPRSRGENLSSVFNPVSLIGSSPLTRGKHQHVGWGEYDERLIPAHAGKTPPACRQGHHQGAHPRSRGENASRDAHSSEPTGSSPLTRGKPVTYADLIGMLRLIPAHAGKTARVIEQQPPEAAHPRSRGENSQVPEALPQGEGSSPLTRGKHLSAMFDRSAGGLIPAHAGKTVTRHEWGAAEGAHPRSRGENQSFTVGSVDGGGSSPLTRGKRADERG